ncbi:hypothetical protein BGZ76_010308 [Entomortierella beljakovae]|nr:hypothetical protein BGZ76_010308 [Entomortierella beljakovae]
MRLESQGQTFLGGNEIDNGDSGSTDRRRLNFNDVFQPELWSRIQFRYAPSVHHIKSLFRCLHLDSETTQGRTFGHDRGGHSVEERDLQSMPTLVLLIGCFHGLDSYTSSGQSSSSICVLPSHFNSQKSSAETSVLSSGANVGLRPYETHPQPSQISFQSYHSMAQTSSQSVVPRMEGLDRERVQYIKDVSGAISEIKDSLQWIERVSGQNVELLIFENTKDPKSLKNRNTYGLQDSRLPSPQELWLQKVVGFWTDAVLMVQHGINIKSTSWPDQSSSQGMSGGGKVLSGKENNNAQPSKDSFCMWVKTQQSINTMVHGGSIYADEKKASSVGAVVGLHWYYDLTKSSFVFHVVS